MGKLLAHAQDCIARCRALAKHSEDTTCTTRTFLCDAMHNVHADLRVWMESLGMRVRLDNAANLRGRYGAALQTLYIGSHLDTVPNAGAFDGVLGVMIGIKLVELLNGRTLPFNVEVLGFSEEEGVRFGFPFIGSLAFIGELYDFHGMRRDSNGVSLEDALLSWDLPEYEEKPEQSLGYLEFHIEQGPLLESLSLPLGIVQAISGQSRMTLSFQGEARHAGTTPMHLRRDALSAAAEMILAVEAFAKRTPDLVATVGRVEALPGAPNVIPGAAAISMDVRHRLDSARLHAVEDLLGQAQGIATKRNLKFAPLLLLDQPSVPMDEALSGRLATAVHRSGQVPHRMPSGAGHDAMIAARAMPAAMLFLRSPGGISHHPEESVTASDVEAALSAGLEFIGLTEQAL